ncbi:MAG TPA: hypothetical protein DEB63_06780 [Agrobacterium sp.]|nr:hypothetical protein [Agrobacterium sp.]
MMGSPNHRSVFAEPLCRGLPRPIPHAHAQSYIERIILMTKPQPVALLMQAPSAKQLATLEDAVRDFGPRIARLRRLGVDESALLRTYMATSRMCGQTSVLEAVADLPPM